MGAGTAVGRAGARGGTSPSVGDAENPSRRPLVWLMPAVLVNLAMSGWLSWHVYNTFQVGREVKDAYVAIEEQRDELCELHQRLIANALMFVAGADHARWEASHRDLSTRLTVLIEELLARERLGRSQRALLRARDTHERLREAEVRAFERARQGQTQASLELLSSEDYEQARQEFSEAAREFVTNHRDLLNRRLLEERDKEIVALLIAFLIWAAGRSIRRRAGRSGRTASI
jgi:hypothetical protein